MSVHTLLYVLAFVFFLLAALGAPKFSWQWLAFASLVLAEIIV